jgi:hypothetical protein
MLLVTAPSVRERNESALVAWSLRVHRNEVLVYFVAGRPSPASGIQGLFERFELAGKAINAIFHVNRRFQQRERSVIVLSVMFVVL